MLYGQRPSDLTVTQASITWAAISIRMIRPLKPSAYWLQRPAANRSEEHTSELQSLMRISYAVFCLKKNSKHINMYRITTNFEFPRKLINIHINSYYSSITIWILITT